MEIYHNHPLAPYTTVKIGGPADTFIITNTTKEFIEALKKYSSDSLTILGNGSNILISDSGIRGTVIKNNSHLIEYLPNNKVKIDSGVQLPFLILDIIHHSLSGLEEFAYIPSTIGGAIFGNIHGVNKNNFDKFIDSIDIYNLKNSEISQLKADQLNWSYDSSDFHKHFEWIILSATLQLSPGNTDQSQQLVNNIIAQKSPIQAMNSLGSVFKNPPGDSAGRIIDQELNLKDFRIGDAQISPKHGNFILNLGHATATDYLAVIHYIQSAATNKGYTLEPEIKFLGKF